MRNISRKRKPNISSLSSDSSGRAGIKLFRGGGPVPSLTSNFQSQKSDVVEKSRTSWTKVGRFDRPRSGREIFSAFDDLFFRKKSDVFLIPTEPFALKVGHFMESRAF